MADDSGRNSDLGLLSAYAPVLAEMLAQVASDITLVLNPKGVIESVVHGGTEVETMRFISGDWVGRALEDTVTTDTRKKARELFSEVSANGFSRLRHLNHPNPVGADIPFSYSMVRLGESGPLLAVGRDLRTVLAMQQRFTSTQQEMEKNYWRMRQAESRYRLLFHIATDAVLVIDTSTLRITDSNQAAARLFGLTSEQLAGRSPTIGIEPEFAAAVEGLLSTALASGTAAEIKVRLAKGGHKVRLSATPYSSQGPTVLLLRARVATEQAANPETASKLVSLVERTHDAIVITDQVGNVVMANPAFAQMLEIEDENEALGRALGGWLGTPENSVALTISALLQSGAVPLMVASLRTDKGRMLQVELSATLLPAADDTFFGFILRAKNVYLMDAPRDPTGTRKIH